MVFRSGRVGRPRYLISEEVLLHLRSSGFTGTKIAQMLLVSRWTSRRRIVEYGLEEMTGFSMISDAQLDNLVERFMSDHRTLVGYSLVSGHLRSLGLRVQRDRSIGRVLPPLTLETLESAGRSLFLGQHILWLVQIAYGILTDTIAW